MSGQDPESKVEIVCIGMLSGRKRRVKDMHKDECDRSGGQKCSEENVEELCQEEHEGYGYKGRKWPQNRAWRNITGGPTYASVDA